MTTTQHTKTRIVRGKLAGLGIIVPGIGMTTPLDDLSEILALGGEVLDRGDRLYFRVREGTPWFWVPSSSVVYVQIAGEPPPAGPGRPRKSG